MPSGSTCWGIEIGSGGIAAIKLSADGDRVKVLDFAVLPHKRVLSTPDTNPDDVLRVSLGALVSRFDLSGAMVAISIPGHAAFARFAKLPPVEPKKVPEIVRFEAVQQIPFPLEEVEWDYQTFVSPDTPDIEVGIFAVTRARIMERLAMCQDVGIVPDIVTLGPVAAYNALAYDLAFDEKTPGTVILDVGTTSTDLVVSEPGRAWVRTFPIGGHHFTQAIAEAYKLTYSKAEKLKKETESTKHAAHVFKAMQPVYQDLAQDVQRSIGYYQSLHPDANLTRLIGVGSTFRLPGIRRFLKQQLQMSVYRIEDFKLMQAAEDAREEELKDASINLVTAAGLALQGLGRASLVANLMPVAVAREAMWKRKVVWFGVAAGLSAAATAAMFIRPFMDNQAVQDNPPPPSISETIQQATFLRNDARDVIDSSEVDFTAANMLDAVGSDHVYAHLLDDVAAMLESADEKAQGDGPAFFLRAYATEYLPPAGSAASSVPMYGMPDPTPVEKTPPKVFNRLTVATKQAGAAAFVVDTLDQWLRDNRSRDGVPYEIADPTWRIVATTRGVDPAELTQGGPGRGLPPARNNPGAGRPGGFSPQGMDPDRERYNPGSGRGSPTGSRGRGGSGSLDTEAPIPDPPPEAAPGEEITTFEVTWEAVVEKPEQEGQL